MEFHGTIGKTLKDSTPWWQTPSEAPPGAPNIVVILLDDLGFSDLGCYGSEIQTPNIDALARNGLRFANYTTVPMCTPARAALLTGKNPHSVGCGWLTHNHPGFPGYQAGEISADVPTLPELLRAQGYSTYAVGKWHNTADYNVAPSAARDSWPLQRGFDQFYGFLFAEVNYFAPGHLVSGNSFVDVSEYPADYYSSDDWTNKAIEWMKAHASTTPRKPFFLYVAHNSPHIPLQAKPRDVFRYEHHYDGGWNELRRSRFLRQKELGVVPDDWVLSEPNQDIPDWSSLDLKQRRVNARYMELYAAMIDNVDQNVGRLVDTLKQTGTFENTIVVITSDNGATAVGGVDGAANIFEKRISKLEAPDLALRMLDEGTLGGIDSYPVYPVGWGNVSNTPFRYYKRTPMNGGIRVPYVLHWPARLKEPGAVRKSWIHVTDTLPTLLECAGLEYPARVSRGLDGFSFAAVLTDSEFRSPRNRQHYELEGNRGYIRDNWKIVSLQPPGKAIDLSNWMLFDLQADPTERLNIARAYPEIVKELIEEFESDAAANSVYPLDNRDSRRMLTLPPFLEERSSMPRTFYQGSPTIPVSVISPLIADRDYVIECAFSHASGAEGVLVAIGNSLGGLSLYIRGDVLWIAYSGGGRRTAHATSGRLKPENVVRLEHTAHGDRRGTGLILLNSQQAATEVDLSPTIIQLAGEGLDVGCDRRIQVSKEYADHGAFRYDGCIHHVRVVPGRQAPGSLSNRLERLAQLD